MARNSIFGDYLATPRGEVRLDLVKQQLDVGMGLVVKVGYGRLGKIKFDKGRIG